MEAYARISAEADGRGGTRLARLRSEAPLVLRQTPEWAGSAMVYLVGGAAGPLGGDRLRLDIEVGPGATLCVRTVAASVALPARTGAPSRFEVAVTVAAGGALAWLPEPTVAAAGCHHLVTASVDLAEGATLRWRDELICGRYGEPSGAATVTTSVRYAGRPLLHQSLSIGDGAGGWDGPAVVDGAKAAGSLLTVGTSEAPSVLGPTAVRMNLAGPGSLVSATAPEAHTLRGYLDAYQEPAPYSAVSQSE
jgi:urease accessory protein